MSLTQHRNEVIKRKFYDYLIHSQGFSEATKNCHEQAIWLWEDFTKGSDFVSFSQTKAKEFKVWLKEKNKAHSEGKVSLTYCYDILRYLRTFFSWVSQQKGYRRIVQTDVQYLNLKKGEVTAATQPKTKRELPLEDVKKVIESVNSKTEIEKRDKALISLMLLSGIRIKAATSLPLQSFNKEKLVVEQSSAFNVQTKFSKKITSSLFPFLYEKSLTYFTQWVEYLEKKGFKPTDPLFPAAKIENCKEDRLGYFSSSEVEPLFWKTTSSARKIIEKRFKQAGVGYYNPHALRHLFVKELSKHPFTEEQKKAISQSLGHSKVETTFGSYGYSHIPEERQVEIIRNINFGDKAYEAKYVLNGKEELKEALREVLADELKRKKE